MLYYLLLGTFKKIENAEKKLSNSYMELSKTHEKLVEREQELRANYELLEENKLRISENEERYRLAVEGSNDIIWDWDINSNTLYLSDKWRSLTGYDNSSILEGGEKWACVIYKDDIDKYREAMQEYLNNRSPYFEYRYRIATANGDIRWFLERGAAIFNENNKAVRMAGSLTDITQKVYYEEEIKNARDEAERANRAKSVFLANMSHELRTPLNGIMAPTELLLNSCNDEEQKMFLDMIKSSSKHLLQLINDVLDISRIEAGNFKMEYRSFSLRKLLEEIYSAHIINARGKGIGFEFINNGTIPDNVIGDNVRLKQVLDNLLSNAFKFTDAGGVALIMTEKHRSKANIELEFEIRDTGIGIREEDITKLFNRFTQLNQSYTKKVGGTGLGLNICKELVGMMEGEIWAKSVFGKGSSFHFTIKLGL